MPNRKLNKNEAIFILNNYFMKGGGGNSSKLTKKKKIKIKPDWCEMSTNPNCIPYSK